MLTEEFVLSGFEFPVLVTHEEDWSGMAIIEWTDPHTQRHRLVEIPSEVLLFLSINQTKRWVLAELEAAIERLKGGPKP
jgi:hypothetical protein